MYEWEMQLQCIISILWSGEIAFDENDDKKMLLQQNEERKY